MPSQAHLGAYCIYSSVGIYSVRSIGMASDGQSYGTIRCRYPVFSLCRYQKSKNQSGLGVCQKKER